MNRFHHTPQDLVKEAKSFYLRLSDIKNQDEAVNNRLALFIIFAVVPIQLVLTLLMSIEAGFGGVLIAPILTFVALWFDVNFLFTPLILLLDTLSAKISRQRKPSRSSAYRKVFFRTWRRLQDIQNIRAQQGDGLLRYANKIKNMDAEIKELKSSKIKEENEVDRLIKLEHASSQTAKNLRLQVSKLEKALTREKENTLEADRRRVSAVQQVKSQLEESQRGVLNDVPITRLVQFFTEQCVDGKISDVATDDIGALYAVMHKHVPDMQRVKEMSLIPNEILRAQQTQTLNNYYSDLIKGVENDDTLSPDEKEDKISIYKMSREQEFGTYS